MATTLYTDLVTLTASSWFNPADTVVYSYLTSPAGTNTITATGPASMTAYAAGQKFSFLPANDNTGATTLNITQSGAAALGAKNVFSGGAACVGGEIQAGIPCTVQYDGTQFHVVGPYNGGLVLGAFTLTSASPQLTLGVLNTTSGGIKFFGSTSGNVTLAPNVAAGASVTVTLPAVTCTLLATDGVLSNLTGTLNAAVVASSLTSVGTLNSGSITSGFGAIDVGADTIYTSGTITGGVFSVQESTFAARTSTTGIISRNSAGTVGSIYFQHGNSTSITQLTNAANTASLFSITDAGAVTIPGTLGVTGALTAASLSTGSGAISGGAISGTTGTFSGVTDFSTDIRGVTSVASDPWYHYHSGTTGLLHLSGGGGGSANIQIFASAHATLAKTISMETDSVERINVSATGVVKMSNLAGTGTRTVVVSSTGVLSAP